MKPLQSLGETFVGHDASWRSLYRVGGVCAVLFVVFILVAIAFDLRAPPPVAGGVATLEFIAVNRMICTSIQHLVASSVLNSTQGNVLLTHLVDAQQQLAQGNIQQAITILYTVIHQITDFIAAGILTPEAGQPLIDAIIVLVSHLPAPSTVYMPHISR